MRTTSALKAFWTKASVSHSTSRTRSAIAYEAETNRDSLSVYSKAHLTRRDDRILTNVVAMMKYANESTEIVIRDISVRGAGLEGCRTLRVDNAVALAFANGRLINAIVRWSLNNRCGILFSTPLRGGDPLLRQKRF